MLRSAASAGWTGQRARGLEARCPRGKQPLSRPEAAVPLSQGTGQKESSKSCKVISPVATRREATSSAREASLQGCHAACCPPPPPPQRAASSPGQTAVRVLWLPASLNLPPGGLLQQNSTSGAGHGTAKPQGASDSGQGPWKLRPPIVRHSQTLGWRRSAWATGKQSKTDTRRFLRSQTKKQLSVHGHLLSRWSLHPPGPGPVPPAASQASRRTSQVSGAPVGPPPPAPTSASG